MVRELALERARLFFEKLGMNPRAIARALGRGSHAQIEQWYSGKFVPSEANLRGLAVVARDRKGWSDPPGEPGLLLRTVLEIRSPAPDPDWANRLGRCASHGEPNLEVEPPSLLLEMWSRESQAINQRFREQLHVQSLLQQQRELEKVRHQHRLVELREARAARIPGLMSMGEWIRSALVE